VRVVSFYFAVINILLCFSKLRVGLLFLLFVRPVSFDLVDIISGERIRQRIRVFLFKTVFLNLHIPEPVECYLKRYLSVCCCLLVK